MEERKSINKKMNYKRIYSQIAKYGRSIPELAKEYGMEEEEFIARIEMGLDPKLFSKAMKASEKLEKQKKKNEEEVARRREETMSRRNQIRHEQTYRDNQSKKDIAANELKKKETIKKVEKAKIKENPVKILETQKADIISKISANESKLDESYKLVEIYEETFTETKKVFEEARVALDKAKNELDREKSIVTEYENSIKELKSSLEEVEAKVTELKNKNIYLVAPGYTGEKPEYGTFLSTMEVPGYELTIREANSEFAIEPELKDMVVAGYDSYKEYMDGLRFVMLCVEYYYNEIEYSVLTNDERIKKLIKAHVN